MNLTQTNAAETFSNIIFSPTLNKILLAIIIMLVGFMAGKLAGLFVRRLLGEMQTDKHLRKTNFKMQLERPLGSAVSFIIYVTTLILAVNTLELTSTMLSLISWALIFILLISFLLAVKDFFPNLLSGLKIKLTKQFQVGDHIKIKETNGDVTYIGLLETRIITHLKEEIIIPNALFMKRKIFLNKNKK